MRTLIKSVTAEDCRWDYFRGSGKVRCTHEPSGAVGTAQDERLQLYNKRRAFRRMAESKKFQEWIKLEASRAAGLEAEITDVVNKQMKDIKVEINVDGKWTEITRV